MLTRRALLGAALAGCHRRRGEAVAPALELWFGGDLHVGGAPRTLEALSPVIDGAAGVVNLEGPVGDAPHATQRGGSVRLSQSADALAASTPRVGTWTFANNHHLDGGEAGVAATRATATRLGTRLVERAARWTVAGRAVELVAWALPEAPPPMARDPTRTLITSIHVTKGRSVLPTAPLREAVEAALAAGARVVVAHGTHRVGPVERRGDAVVAWGLGNLAFSCPCTEERDALILRVRLGDAGVVAQAVPIEAGLAGDEPRLARDPSFAFDVLASRGSSPLSRSGPVAAF